MLAIRMQRTGRKGHAMFRVVVQDARRTPTSGKIVARLGSYDPHAKTAKLDKEKASFYLEHGAQPSGRAALLLKKEGVKLPEWVQIPDKKESTTRNPEKRRSTRPDEPAPAEEEPAAETTAEAETTEAAEAPSEAPTTEAETSNEAAEKPAEEASEPAAEDQPAEKTEEAEPETSSDAPAEESAEDAAPADEEKTDENKS